MKPACDRGPLSTPQAQLRLLRDGSHTPKLRASRLQALVATGDEALTRQGLDFVLRSETDAGSPMPQELVDAVRDAARAPTVGRVIDAELAELKAASEAMAAQPEQAQRALILAGRIEARAGRRFTVAPELRELPEAVAPRQRTYPQSVQDADEVLDAFLSCRQAERGAWQRVKDAPRVQEVQAAAANSALDGMLEATRPR